jgi:hypothetical protein
MEGTKAASTDRPCDPASRRVLDPETLAALRRAASLGDHNASVLLRLASTSGIPQGSRRLVSK